MLPQLATQAVTRVVHLTRAAQSSLTHSREPSHLVQHRHHLNGAPKIHTLSQPGAAHTTSRCLYMYTHALMRKHNATLCKKALPPSAA